MDIPGVGADTPGATYVGGQVFKVITFRCEGIGGGPGLQVQCARLRVRVQEGPDRGRAVTVLADPTVVKAGIVPGDKVRMMHYPANGALAASYVFADFARSSPMLLLAVVFAALVVVVARLRGLAALGGLALSFVVLLKFMVPALLSGESPLAVGVVGCGLIMFIILYLAHGVSVRTTTALIGTWFGLGAAALLGWWAVQAAHLTGLASEENRIVSAMAGHLQMSGLLLCGIIVASLGLLNDVTVTQASAVWEMHALRPDASAARLFTGAMRVGRDHIASTVYTIVFAYAGAALPALLLINLSQRPLGAVLTGETLGEEIMRTLAGSCGLVLSVPLTTAIGVGLVKATAGRQTAGGPTAPQTPDGTPEATAHDPKGDAHEELETPTTTELVRRYARRPDVPPLPHPSRGRRRRIGLPGWRARHWQRARFRGAA